MTASSPDSVRRSAAARAVLVLGLLTIAGLYCAHSLALGYVVDDAFISFQYARNLARGEGLVYNPGEYVEGYTNFLWVLILAGISRVAPQLDMLTAARAMALLSGIVTLGVITRFHSRLHPRGAWLHLVAPLGLALNTAFCAWTMSGLETAAFALLVLLSLVAHHREWTGRGSPWASALFPVVACLLRADGFVLYAILSVARLHEHVSRRRSLVAWPTLVWLGVFLAVMIPYVAWRMYYYGHPLPNTFYAKVGAGIEQYIRGARYAKTFLESYGGILLIPLMLFSLGGDRQAPWRRCAWWLVLGWLAYIVKVGGDGLAFHRFFAVILPVALLLAQDGLRNIWHGAASSQPTSLFPLRSAVAVTALVLAFAGAAPSNQPLRRPDPSIAPYRHFDNYFVERCAVAARWLEQNSPENALVAATPAGAIAFFSDRPVLDMLGLTNEHIARVHVKDLGAGRAGHEKGDGDYVLSRRPDYILIGNVAVGPEPLDHAAMAKALCQRSERELWSSPEFHERYELRTVQLAEQGLFAYFSFYQRKP